MTQKQISKGVVHDVPEDLSKVIISSKDLFDIWEGITSLARNEWICWITSAKKPETREKRINVMKSKFKEGEKRPCCFAGCPHR